MLDFQAFHGRFLVEFGRNLTLGTPFDFMGNSFCSEGLILILLVRSFSYAHKSSQIDARWQKFV